MNRPLLICLIALLIIIIFYFLTKDNEVEYFSMAPEIKNNRRNNTLIDKNKAFVGAWSSNIECGRGLRYVSLASALPQEWNDQMQFFSGHIDGTYDPALSNGYTKYLISIGGSNASQTGWNDFLNDPVQMAVSLNNALSIRGLIGIDFDLEGTSMSNQENIKILVKNLKSLNPNIIIMYTILLGSPQTFSNLITDNQMDYVTLMLYNGGMYTANGSGAGCDWDQWAELFLSGCGVNTCNPLGASSQSYCETIGTVANYANKIIIGVITDTVTNSITNDQLKRAMDLCYKYNGRGIFFWVLPGWADVCSQKNICGEKIAQIKSYNPYINNYFDVNISCPLICPSKVSDCCPSPQHGCQSCDGNCIASSCGKKNSITDALCAPCKNGGQTWWPCNIQGYCQCDKRSRPDNLQPCKDNPDPCQKNIPQPIPQPISPPIPQPIPQPISPPIPQPIPQPISPPIPQPIPQPCPPCNIPSTKKNIYIPNPNGKYNVSQEWCSRNCNADPPFCPPEYCILQKNN